MPFEFNRFDKTTTVGDVNIGKWSFGIREVVLAVVAAILLTIFLVFAGLYGQTRSELASKPKAEASVDQRYCTSDSCLKIAAHITSLMNKSVDRCDNFYQYACGNFDNVKPYLPNTQNDRDILNDLDALNFDRLIALVEEPIDWTNDSLAERKMKEYFKSCNDMDTREKLKGVPFLKSVISKLGGWSVIGTLNSSTWDVDSAMKICHREITSYHLVYTLTDINRFSSQIKLRPGGLGRNLPGSSYTESDDKALKDRNAYKKFMRTVGSLLARDAHELMHPPLGDVSKRKALLDEFIDDVMFFETELAKASHNLSGTVDKMTLADLNLYTGSVLNFVDQVSSFYHLAGVTADTKVIVVSKEYFRNVSDVINSLPAEKRNRVLSNYLIWRVAESYAEDLSWEYISADREMRQVETGPRSHPGAYWYCFYLSRGKFSSALNALYVQEFFDKENKDKIQDITGYLKKSFESQIDQITWFDDVTRKYAKDKLDAVQFFLGYDESQETMDYADEVFTGITFNTADYMGNIFRYNSFWINYFNQILIDPDTLRRQYRYIIRVRMTYRKAYNLIIAAAGGLQFPIYDKSLPHYYNFGSVGSILGFYLHHVIDEYGQMYDKEGKNLDSSWWTNQSVTNYQPVRQCVNKLLEKVTLDAVYTVPWLYLYWDREDRNQQAEFIAFVMGLRLARKAHIDWMGSPGREAEKMLPGVDLNEEQMLYLSHTQMYCQSASHTATFSGEVVNTLALGQLPEFSEAFNCEKGSRMNPAKRCDYN